jgi:hypothetical protein
MLKYFNGTGFKPYGVLPALSIALEGKSVIVEVEVFDAPLDYNLLIGRSWIDVMHTVVSIIFHVIHSVGDGSHSRIAIRSRARRPSVLCHGCS